MITSKNSLNIEFNPDLEYVSTVNDKEIQNNPKVNCFSFNLQQCFSTTYLESLVEFVKDTKKIF